MVEEVEIPRFLHNPDASFDRLIKVDAAVPGRLRRPGGVGLVR